MKRDVTLVEMLDQIGRGLYPSVLMDYMMRVTKEGEKILAGDASHPGRIMEATLDAVNLAYGFME